MRSRSARPSFHAFLVRRLGSPRHAWRFALNWFLKPLCAPSFSGFWRYWNPVYGYVLLFYIYRPLRVRLPRPLALYLTFLASGFFLHDLPFNLSADLYRGQWPVPSVTILFAVFGLLALLSEKWHIDLARHPAWLRVTANLCWLGAGFWFRHYLVAALNSFFHSSA